MKKCWIAVLLLGVFSGLSFGNEMITLTSKDEYGVLIYPTQIEEGPDGNIYVSDAKDYYIKIYSLTGKYLRRIGGKGEGPGMMKRMGRFGFSIDKKSLFFTEYFGGHNWITFTDLEGKYVKTLNLNIRGIYGLLQTVMISESRFIARVEFWMGQKILKKNEYFEYPSLKKVVIINEKGEIEKEVVSRENVFSISMSDRGGDIGIPFQPAFYWCSYGGKIFFTDGLSTNLSCYNYQGDRTGEINTPLPEPENVSDKDLDKWRNEIKASSDYIRRRGAYKHSAKVLDLYRKSIFEKKPNIGHLTTTPEGNILVGSVRNPVDKTRHYWLLNEKGETLFDLKTTGYLVKVTRHFIFLKIMDEDENVDVSFIKRKGNEIEDLGGVVFDD